MRLRGVAAIAVFGCALLVGTGSAVASTPHDLTGTWSCCGSGGAATQTWTITAMDKSSGAFSGTGKGGSYTFPIKGTANGTSITLTTGPYNELPSYTAVFTGTISADSKSMSGSWEDTGKVKGTWTATRPSAPTPSDPSPPNTDGGGGTGIGTAGPKVKPVAGDLYVADSSAPGGSAIYRVNTANGSTTLVHQGAPFSSIRGIAFGSTGNLYVADFGAGAVDEVNLKTGAATRFSQPTTFLSRPWGIAYSHHGDDEGDMLVTDVSLHGLALVNLDNGAVRRGVGGNGLSEPHGISVALNLTPFVADFAASTIFRVTNTAFAFKQGPFNQLQDVAVGFGPNGYRFFTSDSAGGVYTWEEPSTTLQRTQVVPKLLFNGPPLQSATGLALSTDGGTLYVGSAGLAGQGQILAYDLASGKVKVLASGFQTPIGLAVAPPRVTSFQVTGGGSASGTKASPSGVTTTVSSPEVALFTVTVKVVNLPGGGAARISKAVKVKAVQKPVRAGKPTPIKVRFRPSLTRKIKGALRAGRKVKARVAIEASTTTGALSRKVVKLVQLKG